MRKQTWIFGFALIMLMLFLHTDFAFACPNCKENLAGDPTANGLARGFYYSILFMVSMPFLILGSLSLYFYYLVRRAEAEKQLVATPHIALQSSSC